MLKKIFVLFFIYLLAKNFVYAEDLKCTTKGVYTKCYYKGANVLNIQDLRNGFAVVEVTFGGILSQYQTVSLLESKSYIKECGFYLSVLEEAAKEEKRQEQIKKDNTKIITKKTSITTKNGLKITLEEDKNGDDFLIVNEKREKITSGLATSKYESYIKNKQYSLYEISQMEQIKHPNFSYSQILEELGNSYYNTNINNNKFFKLFLTVYKLRDKYGISIDEAYKLMCFANIDESFSKEDLLLPPEISKSLYEKSLKTWENVLSELVFPQV